MSMDIEILKNKNNQTIIEEKEKEFISENQKYKIIEKPTTLIWKYYEKCCRISNSNEQFGRCNYCKNLYLLNKKTTSNLIDHMQKHIDLIENKEDRKWLQDRFEKQKQKKQQSKLKIYKIQPKLSFQNISQSINTNIKEDQIIFDKLMQIILDDQPLILPQKKGFQSSIKRIFPNIKLLTQHHQKYIIQLQKESQNKLIQQFKLDKVNNNSFSLIFDHTTTKVNKKQFISAEISYISNGNLELIFYFTDFSIKNLDFNLKNYHLRTFEVEDTKAMQILLDLEQTLKFYQLIENDADNNYSGNNTSKADMEVEESNHLSNCTVSYKIL